MELLLILPTQITNLKWKLAFSRPEVITTTWWHWMFVRCRPVSAVAPLYSATPKHGFQRCNFTYLQLHCVVITTSGLKKGQFPFPVSYQCRAVSAVAPLDSATAKTWVSTLEFHRCHIPVRSYNYFRFVEVYFHFRLFISVGQYQQ